MLSYNQPGARGNSLLQISYEIFPKKGFPIRGFSDKTIGLSQRVYEIFLE